MQNEVKCNVSLGIGRLCPAVQESNRSTGLVVSQPACLHCQHVGHATHKDLPPTRSGQSSLKFRSLPLQRRCTDSCRDRQVITPGISSAKIVSKLFVVVTTPIVTTTAK